MDTLEDRQRSFLQKFFENAAQVLESGFAYVFAHPNLIPLMDSELQKLRELDQRRCRSPDNTSEYSKTLRKAYIEYIAKLTSYGLEHARYNSVSQKHVSLLKSLFEEYKKLREHCRPCDTQPRPQVRDSTRQRSDIQDQHYQPPFSNAQHHDDQIWEKTLYKIDELHKKIDALEVKISKLPQAREYEMKLEEEGSEDTLVKFNEYLEAKLRGLREENKNKQRKHVQRQRTEERRERKKTVTRRPEISDSSDDSSEILLDFQEYEKPSTVKAKYQLRNIEHHLVIPVEANETPKITPRVCMKKSPIDGSMQLDLKLTFDDGIMFKDKLVSGICIQNALPVRNFRANVE